jgi:glycosyltransferase involved in cell wall biosynthesis
MEPLVSILIPAYNAERWIAGAVQSAVDQTWRRKEIIVIDDGSTDRTAEVVRRFACKGVTLVSTKNQGQCAAVNHGYRLSQGDYIQELDADDLLAPGKIERQLAALRPGDGKRVLLSCPYATFYYSTRNARKVRNSLCQDLSPVEWLLRKMSEPNTHMQPATWLISREVADAAGPWDASLHYDQDGEYFCRVLLSAEAIRFVPDTVIFYRQSDSSRMSYIGGSDRKKESLLRSMKLHVRYLRSLEDSERVRRACLAYLQKWVVHFYPERPDLVAEVDVLAGGLNGRIDKPRLRGKYAWMAPLVGWKSARWAQQTLPGLKAMPARGWERFRYMLEGAAQN